MENIIKNSPVWVWPLGLLLVYIGLKARKPRTIPLARILPLPLLFFIWMVASVYQRFHFLLLTHTILLSGLVMGCILGLLLAGGQGVYHRASKQCELYGSNFTLIFVILVYISKFTLSLLLVKEPMLIDDMTFEMLFILSSGIFSGVFIGRLVGLLKPIRRI